MATAIRYSKKREAIYQVLKNTTSHPSAEWLYQTLKPDHPDLSLGTVYRNLVFFQQQGMVKSVGVVNGQERFDACVSPHCHFVCTHCSAVIDLDSLELNENADRIVSQQYGFEVDRHEFTFFGNCKSCMQNNNNS